MTTHASCGWGTTHIHTTGVMIKTMIQVYEDFVRLHNGVYTSDAFMLVQCRHTRTVSLPNPLT